MAQNDNAAIYWLILATSISSVTTALLYLFQRCCGNCWGNIGNVCFQIFATVLELREETFYQVTNLLTFPRIFQQLELQTFKVVWNHDANAQTGDFVQYGWLRLPTKSYVLAFLAVCGVTHYVYIPFDLKSVEIVGPAHAIRTLVDMSNLAATSSLEEAQLETLRHAFGMGGTWTTADKVCRFWERRFAFALVIVSSLWLAYMLLSGLMFFIALMLGVATLAMVVWYKADKGCNLSSRLQFRRPLSDTSAEMEVALTGTETIPVSNATETRAFQQARTATNVVSGVRESNIASAAYSRPHEETDGSNDVVYSFLLARGRYFEVVKQTIVVPRPPTIVNFAAEARMYAVKMQPNFVHYLAERTTIPENALLHICVYNPLIDPYLTEIYQNFQKGVDRENLLLIILPPLANFDACLHTANLPRTRTASSTQFVGTLGDYETLLLQMTAGFMRRLVFVLPVDEDTHSAHTVSWRIWVSTARVLGESNCFWHCSSSDFSSC